MKVKINEEIFISYCLNLNLSSPWTRAHEHWRSKKHSTIQKQPFTARVIELNGRASIELKVSECQVNATRVTIASKDLLDAIIAWIWRWKKRRCDLDTSIGRRAGIVGIHYRYYVAIT